MFNASTRKETAKQLQDYYQEALKQMNPSRRRKMGRNPELYSLDAAFRHLTQDISDWKNKPWLKTTLVSLLTSLKQQGYLDEKGLTKAKIEKFVNSKFKNSNPRGRFTSKDLREEIDDLNDYYGLTSKTGKFVLSQAYGGNQIQWQIAGSTAVRGITSGYDTPRNAWNSFHDPEYYVKRYKNEKRNPMTRRRKSYDPGATTLIMVPPSMRTTRKMKKPKTTKKKKNPGGCSMTRKNPAVPKGKRKGDHFTRKGKRYVVVSFTNSNGTRVRYARKVKKSRRKGRKGR
jgi:hypothetical protein